MSDLRLGTSTWTFNGLLTQDLREVADGATACPPELAKSIRAYFVELTTTLINSPIKAVELWYSGVFRDDQVWEELERLASTGRVASVHAPFGPELDLSSPDGEIRRAAFEACKSAAEALARLRGKTLVIHGIVVHNMYKGPEYIAGSLRSIGELADLCGELGLQLAVEMLSEPQGTNPMDFLSLLDRVGRPNVGACVDVNHVFPPDMIAPTIETLGPSVLTLHISDYDGREEKHWLPGKGVIDWVGVIHALRKVEYGGPFMYETRFEAHGPEEATSILEENYASLMREAETQ